MCPLSSVRSRPLPVPRPPAQVYKKPCSGDGGLKTCQYENPLAFSPRALPNTLRCATASSNDDVGLCLLGPNKHGDGCNENGECASGRCVDKLGVCAGVPEGGDCKPGFPDPCSPGLYCEPKVGAPLGGRCFKVSSRNAPCYWPTACERGYYCSGASYASRTCIEMFSVKTGLNTTAGPFMCETANAIQIDADPSAVYQCVDVDTTRTVVGTPCDSRQPAPAGYECRCASASGTQGEYQLRSIDGLGLSARGAIWRDLYKCLQKAVNPMGEPCQFDISDMNSIRYGSCSYYGCFPIYLRLAQAAGKRFFEDPLAKFEPTAPCEVEAATAYFDRVSLRAMWRWDDLQGCEGGVGSSRADADRWRSGRAKGGGAGSGWALSPLPIISRSSHSPLIVPFPTPSCPVPVSPPAARGHPLHPDPRHGVLEVLQPPAPCLSLGPGHLGPHRIHLHRRLGRIPLPRLLLQA